jgi:hypothetical protein
MVLQKEDGAEKAGWEGALVDIIFFLFTCHARKWMFVTNARIIAVQHYEHRSQTP